MKFRSKNLLVTGGAGFIGSNFIEYLLKKYKSIKIYNLDSLTYAGKLYNTKNFKNNINYKFIKGNICDSILVDKIFSEYKIDGVINFAAESHVDNSIKNPELFIKTNINGVFNLLNISYKYWMNEPHKPKNSFIKSRFHQISTDEVYGSIAEGSFNEKSPYKPNSPYSASKAAADMLVRSFNKTFGLNTTISISSNNYGPNQNTEKLIPKVIDCFLKNLEIPIYGNGQNVRDWIHVKDNCEAIEIIFQNSDSGAVYNIGGGNELKNVDLINLIYNEISKVKSINKNYLYVDDRYGHDFRYSISSNKIKKHFKWSPKLNFRTSIKEYVISYYKS